MKLAIAICDDDKVALDEETNLIAKILSEKNIKGTVKRFSAPENLLASPVQYDIIFLDVEMGELNGIETAEKLKRKNKNCLVIFVTNYWNYLDNAFAIRAFRYWKKPLDKEQLQDGIDAAINEINNMKQVISVNTKGGAIEIPAKNIVYVYILNAITRVVTIKGEIATYDTYSSVQEQLSAVDCFGELRRGYYVNFTYIQNYTQDSIILKYQEKESELKVSRRKFKEFYKEFNTWLGGKQ